MSQTLKFRLQNGHIYDFKYSKYSDFIDNLEPEPGVIIDVLEPFTFEDFETAQIEYNKYLVFKDALEDIISTRKLWSKEELKEFSNFELNNPVLEWLMIKDTRDDKVIKEKLSLDTLNIDEIKSDNIILYYFVDKTNQEKFIWVCERGHLEVAQWLYSLGDVNIHSEDEYAFRWACENGHLEVTQWLYSLGGVNIHIYEEYAFRWACKNGHLEVAKWLYSLGGVNIHIFDEYPFRHTCFNGHLEVAQWLFSLGGVNIHNENDYSFRLACFNGYLEVAQWLYSLGDVDIHIEDEEAFRWACENGHFEVAQWIWSLGGFHKDGIETTHQPINDWLATLE